MGYGDDLTYNAVIQETFLENIEIIFGNVYLDALDNLECVKNLKYVTGDIQYRGKKYKRISEISK